MMRFLKWAFFISAVFVSLAACNSQENKYYLVILAGQSNAEGLGLVSELPDSLTIPFSDVWIYAPNRVHDFSEIELSGFWQPLQPGFGSGYAVKGKENQFSDKFGLEIGFAKEWKRNNPGKKLAIFKYAKGGSSLHKDAAGEWGSWDDTETKQNGLNQLDYFLANLKNVLASTDINADGTIDTLIPTALIWMQGESDASFTQVIASDYKNQLAKLVQRIRLTVNDPKLLTLIGEISPASKWEYGIAREHAELVRKAQREWVNSDKNARLIQFSEDAVLTDGWHYRSRDYLMMGNVFAKAYFQKIN